MSGGILDKVKAGALDSSPMGVLILSGTERTCVYANMTARELLQIPAIEAFKLESCYCPFKEDGIQPLNADLLAQTGSFMNVALNTLDQRMVIVSLRITVLTEGAQSYLVFSFQDLTQQLKMQRDLTARGKQIRQAYEDLLKQNTQLKELDKAKDRFIGLVTHELRTPLSGMMATIDFIHQGFCASEEQLKQFIATATEQGKHLAELIDDILDFSKLQAGGTDFYISLAPLAGEVESACEGLKKRAEQARVQLHMESSIRECPDCYYDDRRLRQVLDNILSNAIKFNKENGNVKLWATWDDQKVSIHIADQGRGIAAEDLDRVFNEFETLGQLSKHQKGTGLGMPISRRLIEGMGGKIGVKSQVGVGSEFWLEIPRHKVLKDEVYRLRPDQEDDLLAS